MNRNLVRTSQLLTYSMCWPLNATECLKKTWCSSVYGFFKKNVEVKYENGCKFHLFQCAAKKCKANGVVQWYLDSKDRAATSNLKMHAIKCFGIDAIKSADDKMKSSPRDGSIFASFTRPGQQSVSVSHQALTNEETWQVFNLILSSDSVMFLQGSHC